MNGERHNDATAFAHAAKLASLTDQDRGLLASVAERSEDFVAIVVRNSGHLRFLNPTARSWLGLGDEIASDFHFPNLAGSVWLGVLQAQRAVENWQEALTRGQASWEARVLNRSTGAELDVICRLVADDEDFALTLHDVTTLKATLRDAEEVKEEFKRFAYIVSHDLKESLRMISSYLQLVRRRLPTPLGDLEEFMAFAIDGAKRLGGQLDALVQFSRADAGADEKEWASADELLTQALNALAVPIADAGAVVHRTPLPRLYTSPRLVTAVLTHLVSNAIRFHSAEPPRIHIGARERGRDWLFWVKDEGIGMEPADLERAFGVFQRLSGSDELGHGMGLPISRKILSRLGGKIWIEAKPSAGATVFFTLPRVSEISA